MKPVHIAGILMMMVASPAVAFTPKVPTSTASINKVRWMCDEWGRCWDQPEYNQRQPSRYGYGYGAGGPYGRYYQPERLPSKWERKGFCPPGQRKKGNC